MPVHKVEFTPWQLRTIRALALAEGTRTDAALDAESDKRSRKNYTPTPIDDMHLRLLGDYREMLSDMVEQIEEYAKEVGGI